MTPSHPKRDLLSIADIAPELTDLLRRAHEMKTARRAGDLSRTLQGTNVALIFEKPSTRTGRRSRSR